MKPKSVEIEECPCHSCLVFTMCREQVIIRMARDFTAWNTFKESCPKFKRYYDGKVGKYWYIPVVIEKIFKI